MSHSLIGLIPARSGSKRIANKNAMPVNGHPLLAYSVSAALDSGIFDRVVVSTDSQEYAAIARHYGAEVPHPTSNTYLPTRSFSITAKSIN